MTRRALVLMLAVLMTATLSVPAAATGNVESFVIVANGNDVPAEWTQEIADAGGTLVDTIPQIGVALAESSDAGFRQAAEEIDGVRSVLPNDALDWPEPMGPVLAGSGPEAEDLSGGGPDDPLYAMQWWTTAIHAPGAWAAGYTGDGARVAILDSGCPAEVDGIGVDHPDLAPNLNKALSRSFAPGGEPFNLVPAGGNHGTQVALILAAADNDYGNIGVAPDVELVALKVYSPFTGSWYIPDVLDAIVYAADIDADVASMSWLINFQHSGTPWFGLDASATAEYINLFRRATSYAYQQGTLLVGAAGNWYPEGRDFDGDKDHFTVPAQLPHVLSAAATAPLGWGLDPTTDLDLPTMYTAYGKSYIDFAAPGGDVIRSIGQDPYSMCTVSSVTLPCWALDGVSGLDFNGVLQYGWSGTSFSAPTVAGVAALIIGKHGGSMHPAQVRAKLRQSADDLGKPGKDDYYGHGRVNAYAAVQ